MAYATRVLNSEITTLLSIVQRDETGAEVAVDADETPTAEIRRLGVLAFEISAAQVTHEGEGSYSFEWTPVIVGIYTIEWSYAVGEEDYTSEEIVDVIAEVEGTSDSSLPADADVGVPGLGTSKTCLVTGTFYDARGDAMPGVYVRFTPDRDTTVFLTSGIVAAETTAESDEDGEVSLYLVRGVTGLIAITGVGITRRVTVPDVAALDLKSLVEFGDDLLEVQRPMFYKLPRRSL